MQQRSLSPVYLNEEDFLKPKIPQNSNRLPQFCRYQKENIQYPQMIQTVKKKHLIFENRNITHQNISPLRTNQMQFRVSQPKSPVIMRTNEFQVVSKSPIQYQKQIQNSLTPTKMNTQQSQKQFHQPITVIQQSKSNNFVNKNHEEQKVLTNIKSVTQFNQNIEHIPQFQNKSIINNTTNYACLEEELMKSELKLKLLTERSQKIEEQRIQLRNTFKNTSKVITKV